MMLGRALGGNAKTSISATLLPPTLELHKNTRSLSFMQEISSLTDLKKIHAHMIKTAMDQDIYQMSKLVEFSALSTSGSFRYASELFARIENPNLFVYNTIIRGSVKSNQMENAILVYARMRGEFLKPNNFTFPFVLRACEEQFELQQGEEVHGCILRTGFGSDVVVLTSLLNMYAVCGTMIEATKVFEEMPVRDVVSWNSIISGHLRYSQLELARSYFDRMLERSIISWNSMIAGYANSGEINEAKKMFDEMVVKDTVSWNSMVGGYVKAGDMISARRTFEMMPEKDAVSWTTMIDGYVKNAQFNHALIIFHQMQLAKARPSQVTLLSVLCACANLSALDLGRWVHDYIEKNGYMLDNNLGTALIDMYAKCGDMDKGLEVLYMIEKKDVITWTAAITGLAINGRCQEALNCFSQMVTEGLRPDSVTFLGVLCACSHAGFIEEGYQYFNSMSSDYQLLPGIEHYSCMVDLLGRTGNLEEAEELVKYIPVQPDSVVWGSLIGACQVYNNVEMAERIIKRLLEMEPDNRANYITLSNIYAAAGRWTDVAEMRKKLKAIGVRRTPGCSSIEVNYEVHEFVSGDCSHTRSREVYEMLAVLAGRMKVEGYVTDALFPLQ